jgi:tetrahydromethanopterin S-methyltransferase subunit G
MVKRIEQVQDSNEVLLEKRLEKIENKLDSLLSLLYERAIKPNK